jgi:hypothetical protein
LLTKPTAQADLETLRTKPTAQADLETLRTKPTAQADLQTQCKNFYIAIDIYIKMKKKNSTVLY